MGWLGWDWLERVRTGENSHFVDKAYFAFSRILIYAIPPLLFSHFVLGKKPSELGWKLRVDWAHVRVYVALYFLVLPFVWWASTQESFDNFYPFFRPEGYEPAWKYFAAWEMMYFAYFLAFEFFFRGFILQALRPRFGTMAVAFMMIPYVMIHFRKPFLEAIGAIFAGLVLGILAYRSRNAFPGALLHYAVALTMDLLAVEGL
jgi:membrane protease YdiL (CAAX protease family)